MNMTNKRVAELEGAQLDWAVAKAAGYDCAMNWAGTVDITQKSAQSMGIPDSLWCGAYGHGSVNFRPSEWWAHGGPIIERERISLWEYDDCYAEVVAGNVFAAVGGVHGWDDGTLVSNDCHTGPTRLIAAMRAFVASKLGDEVEVPECS
ncbi:MAG: phage protein NinX family protein [Rhodospirillaceae bacterium]